jgi:hypothetical protein
MSPPVEAGQDILIPLFDADAPNKLYHISWSQNLATRNADYYCVTADNITLGSSTIIFLYQVLMVNLQARSSRSLSPLSSTREVPRPTPSTSPRLASFSQAVSCLGLHFSVAIPDLSM